MHEWVYGYSRNEIVGWNYCCRHRYAVLSKLVGHVRVVDRILDAILQRTFSCLDSIFFLLVND